MSEDTRDTGQGQGGGPRTAEARAIPRGSGNSACSREGPGDGVEEKGQGTGGTAYLPLDAGEVGRGVNRPGGAQPVPRWRRL